MFALETELKDRAERHIERHIGPEFVPASTSTSRTDVVNKGESPGLAEEMKE